MVARRSAPPRAAALAMSLILAVGCAPAVTPSSPTPSQTPADFELEVIPARSVGRTIGGQQFVFLVTASGSPSDGPVELAAVAEGASVSIQPQPLTPGVVGEVTVVPAPATDETELPVTITGSRREIERTVQRALSLSPGDDSLQGEAEDHLAPFLVWLGTHRPELGIDGQTPLESTPGSWVLIVNHYLFFSEDWEIELSWHVMIPPDDWSRIYLRHRWTESHPSLAFEIPTVTAEAEPREVAPPDDVWR